MKSNKKILIGVLSIAIVVVLSVGSTLAFLTDSEEKVNTFAVGDLDITLEEPNWDPEKGTDLYPGASMMKDPVISEIENNSYMRVYVKFIDDNATILNPDYVDEETTPNVDKTIPNPNRGKVITDTNRLDLIKQTMYYDSSFNQENGTGIIDTNEMYTLDQLASLVNVNNGVNETSFTKDSEHSSTGIDCYNYNTIFNEGDDVILFTNIVIPTDWNQNNMALLGKYNIVVYAQAIQSNGFENAAAAFAALDKEVEDNTIQRNHGQVGE